MPTDPKSDLHDYLRAGRRAVIWKLEDLSEYDIRRPMVPSGTNLLGLVKHLAAMEIAYLGDTFSRPFGERLDWMDEGAEANADMWAAPEEGRGDLVALYERAGAHGDSTIDILTLDARGQVPWWPPERREVSLHRVLVHLIAETQRHAGHADIVRELIDGSAGLRADNGNMAAGDRDWWERYRSRLEDAARRAGGAG